MQRRTEHALRQLLPLLSLVYSVVPGQGRTIARTGMSMHFAPSWGVLALMQAQAQAHTGACMGIDTHRHTYTQAHAWSHRERDGDGGKKHPLTF